MQRSTIIHVLRMAAVALTQAVATEDIPAAIWWLMWAAFVVEQASQYDSALRRLSRFYFTRPDLLLPMDAPAAAVLQSRTDKGMLQFMHVDRRTFDLILENVDPMWVRSRLPAGENGRVGRPNMLSGELCVALALTWMCTTVNEAQLEQLYGVGHSVVNRDLDEGLEQLENACVRLGCVPQWPSRDRQEQLAEVMDEYWGPDIFGTKAFALVDGLRSPVESPGGLVAQNLLYSGFMREVNVLSLLVFTIDGKIIYADVGHPGRMSDNTLQPRLTHILTEPGNLAPGHGILGDDIFRNAATDRIYITQYHVPDIIDAEFVRENRNLFAVQQKAKRQGVEWGMRSIQTMWPRIKKALPNDPAKRIARLRLAVYLTNLLAEYVNHHNELKTVYMEAFLRNGE